MPGLNQLKQFASDIMNVGDETKIRAQRGEKPARVPLPEGISEEDDSEDFVLGLPDTTPDNSSGDSENSDDDDDADSISQTENTDGEEGSGLPPDLEAILNPGAAAGNDVPDLSDFLDEPAAPEAPEETPLEDLDLDALLKPQEPEEEQTDAEAENSAIPDFESSTSDALDNADSFEIPDFDTDIINDAEPVEAEPADAEPAVEAEQVEPAEAVPEAETVDETVEPEPVEDFEQASSDETLEPLPEEKDEFSFDGAEINLNEDVPEEIAEEDGSMPVEPETAEEESPEETDEASEPVVEEAPAEEEAPVVEEAAEEEAPVVEEAAAEEAPAAETENQENEAPAPASDIDFGDLPDFDAPPAGDGGINFGDLPDFDAPAQDSETPADGTGTAAEALFSGNESPVDASLDVPAEDFSSSMEGMGDTSSIDFGSSGDLSDEFPVTDVKKADDDFALDESEFEIPGFSDTQTAAFDKKGRPKVDVADFSQAATGKPKNTLTDDEYKLFRKNLALYPLNLRLVIEDLIVKNEFTDDAVFEVVEKILKKTPARQVATHLEKMLDISIDVPRDYERRSVAQYEAYKQSFGYQLKNRIIPGGIAITLLSVIGYLLVAAGVKFIYKPAMANMLYKQGYTLLCNNEYPQSEEKFSAAIQYKTVKKWFFKYADGYRSHKQYERAGQMYKNILTFFKHDKAAGLQWSEMELYDRANYEKAENIDRREVLDYHINDADGLLLLGDIFLEWAESDPEKYESAREQYSNLLNLYGPSDLYMSRMMRYFIRTDKLRNVLELKGSFYPRKKSLCAADWTELSGYLLDKLYGPLSRSDEYLRSQIEDVRAMLELAIECNDKDPAAHYNMARYFLETNNFEASKRELQQALDCFDGLETRTKKNTYREIDSCRLLGELYADTREYLKAQEIYTRGISLYQTEKQLTGFEGDHNTGLLYADMGDIEYFVSGDMAAALEDYEQSLENKNDTPSINYRIGAINYGYNKYDKALASFIKAASSNDSDINLLLALGNVLELRGDNFAAQGYYSNLLSRLDKEKESHWILEPQTESEDYNLVDMFLKANNNLGVVLYKIARQTGDSRKNAEALVRLSDSIRAWDALTRNPETMVRLDGSNLALQNSKYITASRSDYEPAIYTDIPKTMTAEKVLQ